MDSGRGGGSSNSSLYRPCLSMLPQQLNIFMHGTKTSSSFTIIGSRACICCTRLDCISKSAAVSISAAQQHHTHPLSCCHVPCFQGPTWHQKECSCQFKSASVAVATATTASALQQVLTHPCSTTLAQWQRPSTHIITSQVQPLKPISTSHTLTPHIVTSTTQRQTVMMRLQQQQQ